MLPEHQFPAAPAHSPEGIHPWLVQAPPIEENRPLGKNYYYIFDIFSRGAETLETVVQNLQKSVEKYRSVSQMSEQSLVLTSSGVQNVLLLIKKRPKKIKKKCSQGIGWKGPFLKNPQKYIILGVLYCFQMAIV